MTENLRTLLLIGGGVGLVFAFGITAAMVIGICLWVWIPMAIAVIKRKVW